MKIIKNVVLTQAKISWKVSANSVGILSKDAIFVMMIRTTIDVPLVCKVHSVMEIHALLVAMIVLIVGVWLAVQHVHLDIINLGEVV